MAAAQGLAARLKRAGLRMVHPALGLAALGARPPLTDAALPLWKAISRLLKSICSSLIICYMTLYARVLCRRCNQLCRFGAAR